MEVLVRERAAERKAFINRFAIPEGCVATKVRICSIISIYNIIKASLGFTKRKTCGSNRGLLSESKSDIKLLSLTLTSEHSFIDICHYFTS